MLAQVGMWSYGVISVGIVLAQVGLIGRWVGMWSYRVISVGPGGF